MSRTLVLDSRVDSILFWTCQCFGYSCQNQELSDEIEQLICAFVCVSMSELSVYH